MTVKDAIENRRSIRKFLDKEVSSEILLKLIDCARLAPSAKNRQPWKFKILNDIEKEMIIKMMFSFDKNTENKISSSISFTANVMENIPSIILVFREKDNSWNEFDLLSIGASIENICLYAEELNLSTLWIGDIVFIKDTISSYLNIQDLDLVSAIGVGYKNQDPHQRPRKNIKDILI